MCLPQGVTLMLGRHFEGDGVCGQLRADEHPRRATSQRCTNRHFYQLSLGFSQILVQKIKVFCLFVSFC